mmetsp:Transcript_18290/g.38253  ORF Transcript_18290/g.38253 Transcript_18290/m.38253 type:complete len:259 (+) Transcript_18290:1078-1854(+)
MHRCTSALNCRFIMIALCSCTLCNFFTSESCSRLELSILAIHSISKVSMSFLSSVLILFISLLNSAFACLYSSNLWQSSFFVDSRSRRSISSLFFSISWRSLGSTALAASRFSLGDIFWSLFLSSSLSAFCQLFLTSSRSWTLSLSSCSHISCSYLTVLSMSDFILAIVFSSDSQSVCNFTFSFSCLFKTQSRCDFTHSRRFFHSCFTDLIFCTCSDSFFTRSECSSSTIFFLFSNSTFIAAARVCISRLKDFNSCSC